tara:strand:+ start:947 stop:1810 length:864 start_codon:yes stop_codon:yes gene_type:complete
MHLFKSKESLGILFAILAYFSFSVLDAFQKTAVIYHSIFQLLLIKYFFVLLLAYFESYRNQNIKFYLSKNIKLQIFRCILSIAESACFALAFRYLSLADAHSIGSLTPVIVVILSSIILREYVSYKTWIAIFIGFIGVLIIMRPGLSIFDAKSLIPLTAAFFLGFYQVITKITSKYDSPQTSLFYNGIIGIIIMSFMSFFYWKELNTTSYILLTCIGIFFSIGLYFQIVALTKARASIIQPFHYTLIFWAIIWGYLIYDDLPDLPTVIGAIIITISGIYVINQKTTE